MKCFFKLHFVTVVEIIQQLEKYSCHVSLKLHRHLATCLIFGFSFFRNQSDFKKQSLFVLICCKSFDLNNDVAEKAGYSVLSLSPYRRILNPIKMARASL